MHISRRNDLAGSLDVGKLVGHGRRGKTEDSQAEQGRFEQFGKFHFILSLVNLATIAGWISYWTLSRAASDRRRGTSQNGGQVQPVFASAVDRDLVTGVSMAHHAGRRIIP